MHFAILVLCLLAAFPVYSDATTAYAAATTGVFRIDLTTGNFSVVNGGVNGSGITLENSSIAYGTSLLPPPDVYRLDVTSGALSEIASVPLEATGIQLADSSTAFVSQAVVGASNIYRLNLSNDATSLVTPSPIPDVIQALALEMSITNPTVAYGASDTGNVWRIDLTNGKFSQVGSIPEVGSDSFGICLADNNTAYVTAENLAVQ